MQYVMILLATALVILILGAPTFRRMLHEEHVTKPAKPVATQPVHSEPDLHEVREDGPRTEIRPGVTSTTATTTTTTPDPSTYFFSDPTLSFTVTATGYSPA
jgi:hypothetical protein